MGGELDFVRSFCGGEKNTVNRSGSELGLVTRTRAHGPVFILHIIFPGKRKTCQLPLPLLYTEFPFLS